MFSTINELREVMNQGRMNRNDIYAMRDREIARIEAESARIEAAAAHQEAINQARHNKRMDLIKKMGEAATRKDFAEMTKLKAELNKIGY